MQTTLFCDFCDKAACRPLSDLSSATIFPYRSFYCSRGYHYYCYYYLMPDMNSSIQMCICFSCFLLGRASSGSGVSSFCANFPGTQSSNCTSSRSIPRLPSHSPRAQRMKTKAPQQFLSSLHRPASDSSPRSLLNPVTECEALLARRLTCLVGRSEDA